MQSKKLEIHSLSKINTDIENIEYMKSKDKL